MGYPLANIQKTIENGHRTIEIVDLTIKNGDFPYVWYIPSLSFIVDLPINSLVIFHCFLYVYQRV